MPFEPIVVVGSACRFPGGVDGPSKLWELMIQGRDVQSEVPKDRFNIDSFFHKEPSHPGRTNARHGYFITEDVRSFDASFFGIQAGEAESVDPQQRLVLETTYEALCSAGIPIQRLKGSPTAVYLGMMTHDYEMTRVLDMNHTPTYGVTGSAGSIASNRVSYFFDWHGPSMTIDTACSSSLVAVHQAVQQLRSGGSKVAIAAGTNLILSPLGYITESQLRMLSPTGRSRMWDASADGYARGEGVAALVLKTLTQAIQDGDSIECIIRETGVNQDGRTPGLTMPSARAQEALIRQTYEKAGLDPEVNGCQYFEAHGTGTPAGDPQEADAICSAFFPSAEAGNTPKAKLIVGSIKTVIGHTEGTAGIAGLLKASMAVQKGVVPPNLLFETLSPRVAPFYKNLQIVTKPTQWPSLAPGQPRRASVNSFGFGGTNAHAIIEQYIPPSTNGTGGQDDDSTVPNILPLTLSASSEKSLRRSMERTLELLRDPGLSIADVAWTLAGRQSALAVRKAVGASSREACCAKLERLLGGSDLGAVKTTQPRGSDAQNAPRLLGIFTGQGAQWPGMMKSLVQTLPFARAVVEELDSSLQTLPEKYRPSWTLLGELLSDPDKSRLDESIVSIPMCLTVQVVLCRLLSAAGVVFDAVVGHSGGETAAAYVSGHLTAFQAIRVAYLRMEAGRQLYKQQGWQGGQGGLAAPGEGAMLAAGVTHEDAEEICGLPVFEGRVCIGAYNAPESITFSGDAEAIERLEALLKDESKFARRLRVDRAYHSHHMQPLAAPYIEALNACGCAPKEGKNLPRLAPVWYSSAHLGKRMEYGDATPEYWRDNLVNPVLFAQAIEAALSGSGKPEAVVEVGCHPALTSPVLSTINNVLSQEPPYTGCMQRGGDGPQDFADALGFLWERFGVRAMNPNALLSTVYSSFKPKNISKQIPTYPWDHSRLFWNDSRAIKAALHGPAPHLLLGQPSLYNTSSTFQWRNVLRLKDHHWMQGHMLQGQTILPAAGYIVLALEAAMQIADGKPVQLLELLDIDVDKAITFDSENSLAEVVTLAVAEVNDDGGDEAHVLRLTVDSCFGRETRLSTSFGCRIRISFGDSRPGILGPVRPEPPHAKNIDMDAFYRSIKALGYDYDENYRKMRRMRRADGKCIGAVENIPLKDGDHVLMAHPATMDLVFQSIMGAYSFPGDQRIRSLYVPVHVDRIAVIPENCYAASTRDEVGFHIAMVHDKGDTLSCDTQVFDTNTGRVMYQIDNLSSKPLAKPSPSEGHRVFLEWVWGPLEPDRLIGDRETWLTTHDRDNIRNIERITFYYIRQVLRQLTPKDVQNASPHHSQLIKWCRHVLEEGEAGRETWYQASWADDDESTIEKLCQDNWNHPQVRMTKRVGENMASTIRDNSNPFQWMNADGALTDFYNSDMVFGPALGQTRHLFGQLAHRNPKLDILEIGAGTGGTTKFILSTPGLQFNSYTYTDISMSFFQEARQTFANWEDQMEFRTLDVRVDPTEQGYTAGSYDVVFASNVLHATPSLGETLRNVRTLLKPGGRVVLLDIAGGECVRYGFTFGLFPDWWAGLADGREWHPWTTVDGWDAVMRASGFSGIDVRTITDHDDVYPALLFSAVAVDDTINRLASPLEAPPRDELQRGELVIVGGGTAATRPLAERIRQHLRRDVRVIDRLEQAARAELRDKSSFLVLSDLDEEQRLFAELDETKFEAVKALLKSAAHLVWLTQSAWIQNPAQAGSIGLLRSARMEYPGLAVQVIDFDDDLDSAFVAAQLLRLEEASAVPPGWSSPWPIEPEICWVKGRALVPRMRRDKSRNDRLTSARCPVAETVKSLTVPVALRKAAGGGGYSLQLAQNYLPCDPYLVEKTIRVQYSTLKAVRVGTAGYLHLLVGAVQDTGEVVVGFSPKNASVVRLPSTHFASLGVAVPPQSLVAALLRAVSSAMAQSLLAGVSEQTDLLVLNPPDFGIEELARQADIRHVKLHIAATTEEPAAELGRVPCIGLHPHAMERELLKILPRNVSVLYDLSGPAAQSKALGSRVARVLASATRRHDVAYLVDDEASPLSNHARKPILPELTGVLEAIRSWVPTVHDGSHVISASRTCALPSKELGMYSVVDWTQDEELPALTRPIDSEPLFASDKTYLLVGLGGDLGRSLARWMVSSGARYIVLSSRKPETPSPLWTSEVEATGAQVVTMPIDVTDEASIDVGLERIRATLPTIGGIAFGPLVLSDVLFKNMSFHEMEIVLKPRVRASRILHERFLDPSQPLDFFVMLSSVASTTGNPGQANYTASNAQIQALAQKRQAAGLAGSTISIGAVFGVGIIHRVGREADFSTHQYQTDTLSEDELHALFAEAVVSGRQFMCRAQDDSLDVTKVVDLEITTGIVDLDPAHSEAIMIWDDPRFAGLKRTQRRSQKHGGQDAGASGGSIRDQLLSATDLKQACDAIIAGLSAKLRASLQLEGDEKLDPTVPLVDQGVDSLGAITVTQWFSKELLIDIPILKILGGASVVSLADEAVARLPASSIPLIQRANGDQAPDGAGHEINGITDADTDDIGTAALDQDLAEKPHPEEPVLVRREPLSPGQAHAWSLQRANPDKPCLLNNTIGMFLSGGIHVGRFSRAWNMVFARHETFRTAFVEADGTIMQEILSRPKVHLVVKHVTDRDEAVRCYEAMKTETYNLAAGNGVKLVLFRWGGDTSLLVYGYHRLVGDGSTTENLFAEAAQLYGGTRLPAPALQYTQFAARQAADLAAGRLQDDVGYWTALFADGPPQPLPVLPLPHATPGNAPGPPSWAHHTATLRLPESTALRVREVSRQFKASAVHLYLAALHVLLARAAETAGGSSDICIGLSDTGRAGGTGDSAVMGFLANTLPLRLAEYAAGRPFSDEVGAAKDAVASAVLHSRIPYPEILERLGLKGDGTTRHHVMPLFQAVFDYRQGATESGIIGEARIVDTLVSREAMPYDVSLDISDDPGRSPLLTLRLQTSLYGASDAEVFLREYASVVSTFVQNPAMRLSDLRLSLE
ncbi:hypothetical protein MCOR25_009023 [Pyricularia grisea]|nr:hypothetical protein MCOR25_009023 [Pyricularia grisea]